MNPITSIWTQPRETVRMLGEKPSPQAFTILAAIYGAVHTVHGIMRHGVDLSPGRSPMMVLGTGLLEGAIYGIAILSVFSLILSWTGRLLGGSGRPAHVRSALAWSFLPYVPLLVLLIPVFLLGYESLPQRSASVASGGSLRRPPLHPLMVLYFLPRLVFTIWSLVLAVVGLAEVMRISILRSVAVYALAALIFIIPLVGLLVVVAKAGIF